MDESYIALVAWRTLFRADRSGKHARDEPLVAIGLQGSQWYCTGFTVLARAGTRTVAD